MGEVSLFLIFFSDLMSDVFCIDIALLVIIFDKSNNSPSGPLPEFSAEAGGADPGPAHHHIVIISTTAHRELDRRTCECKNNKHLNASGYSNTDCFV